MPQNAIKAPRLILRNYSVGDRSEFTRLNGDPIVREKMGGPLDQTAANLVFDRVMSERYSFAVFEKASSVFVGHIYCSKSDVENEGEIGFLFFPEYWGMGYATESAEALISVLSSNSEFEQIIATIDDDHHPSKRVLEKLGFIFVSEETDDEGSFLLFKKSI